MEEMAAAAQLSYSQESLWFLEQLNPGTSRHHIRKVWLVSGPVNVDALRRALRAVCERHSALRTVFEEEGGQPSARVLAGSPELEECDWSGLSPDEREVRLEEACGRPFDLAREAPARFLLARTAESAWILLLLFHHIAVDGWSLGIFDAELTECYRAFLRGESPSLEPVAVQFHEYAVRERDRLDRAELDRLAAGRAEQLAGAPPLALPGRGTGAKPGGGVVSTTIAKGVADRVRSLARANRTTANAVYLAALEALLARYSGQSDFAVGIAYANRVEPELAGCIGFFVNTLLLRADLAGGPTFRQLLERVTGGLFDALESGHLPLSELVNRLSLPRERDAGMPCNVLFAYQNYPGGGFALEGAEVKESNLGRSVPPVADLTITAYPSAGEAHFVLWYSRRALSEPMAQRFVLHYANLLAAAVELPDLPLSQLEYLDPEERRRILEWGAGPGAQGLERRVEEVFAEQARANPQRPALRQGAETLTYAQLDARANRLANLLAARGLEPGGYVGVLAPRGLRLVECWLAVLKAGCAYVPLDPSDPPERLAGQLADCGAAAVLSLTAPPAGLVGAAPLMVELNDCEEELAAQPEEAPQHGPEAGPVACVMFSSGSTGRPKGAAVPHRGILRLLLDNGYARYTQDDNWLFMAPPSFDASTLEVWGPLLNGGCCAVLPAGIPSLAALGEAIGRNKVSVLWLTSSLFNAIVDDEPEILGGVRLVMTGGEALSVTHVRKALALLPRTRLINGYGPTENTTFTTCWEIPRDLTAKAASVPIGVPIAGTRVYVLDAAGRLVPAGVAGELYAAGDGVALGYLGLPELTAERFVPDPFAEEPGRSMYRTGDVVRWLDSGVLEFLGRADFQVKIRGHRVEPGELEAALEAHEAVRQACVCVGEDAAGKFLAAYYTAGKPVQTAELRRFLEARLPHYLLPRELVELSAFPLLPTGKVDRGALASFRAARSEREESASNEPTVHGAEEQLAAIWRRVLGRKIISRDDDFFDLGGNSLAAVRLVSLMRKEMGAQLQVAEVFLNPVLSNLAATVAHCAAQRKSKFVIQPDGWLPPVHSLSAGPRFRRLAQHLAPERPVFGLPVLPVEELVHPCRCEDLAARYAEWLETARPGGPWILTGWCLAGVVAFETARLLQGRGPGAVILLDSPCPVRTRKRSPLERMARAAGKIAYHGRVVLSGRHGGLASYMRERWQTFRDQRALRAFEGRYEAAFGSGARDGGVFELQDLVNYAASHYTPPSPLDWPVLLLRATERQHDLKEDADWGWRPHAPHLEVAWAEGDHGTIFEEPYVAESARLIRGWLERIPELS